MSALLEAAQKDGIIPEVQMTTPAVVETPASTEQTQTTETTSTETKEVEQAKAPEKKEEAAKVEKKDIISKDGKKPWERIEVKKAPEAKKDAAKVADDADIPPAPEGTNEKGQTTWKELHQAKKERDKLSAEMTELRKQIETAAPGKAEELQKELEATRKERDEISQLVAERKLERSDEFKKAVVEPIATASKQIDQLVKMGGIDKKAMEAAVGIVDETERHVAVSKVLRQAEKAISEKRSELEARIENGEANAADLDAIGDPLDATLITQLNNAISKLHTAWSEEDKLRAQAREIEGAARARDEAEKARREKAAADEWASAHKTIREELSSKLTDIFGDPDLAKQATEAAVKPADAVDAAYQSFAGALLPHYVDLANKRQERIAELEELLGERQGAKPSMSGATEKVKTEAQEMSLLEAARAAGYG